MKEKSQKRKIEETQLAVVVENSEALKKEQMKKWIVGREVAKQQKKGWLH